MTNKGELRDLHQLLCNIANLRAIGDREGIVELSKPAFDMIRETAWKAAMVVMEKMQEAEA